MHVLINVVRTHVLSEILVVELKHVLWRIACLFVLSVVFVQTDLCQARPANVWKVKIWLKGLFIKNRIYLPQLVSSTLSNNHTIYFLVTATPECFRHDDCRNAEVCHTGSCINACIVKDCADNAICSTTVHDIACTCRPGFTGDGHVRCSLCKYWNVMLNVYVHVKILEYQVC